MRLVLALLCLTSPTVAQVELALGPSDRTFAQDRAFASYSMPVGPAGEGPMRTVLAEGALTQNVWEVDITGTTTLRIMDGLRLGLEDQGFEVLYECATQICGGFDFRFATRVAPEPAMHVDLGDFRYLAVQRLGLAVPEYLSLLVSRSAVRGYVQMIHVGPVAVQPDKNLTDTVQAASGSVQAALETNGVAVLDDLEFRTGSSELGDGAFPSLQEIASFLADFPDRRIVLVGHTDAVGSLENNISLSRRRAQSVVDRLVVTHGVAVSQLGAEGVGFLSPVASNLTEEGRTQNRRVEAVLASTQ